MVTSQPPPVDVSGSAINWSDEDLKELALELLGPEAVGNAEGDALVSALAAVFERLADGEAVSEAELLEALEERISAGSDQLSALLDSAINGAMTVEELQEQFAFELSQAHLQALALGVGGFENISAAELEILFDRMVLEFGFLQDLLEQIASGEISPAKARQRMQRYMNAVWSSFWKGAALFATGMGATEKIRDLEPTASHCGDCPGLAGFWGPVDEIPSPGEESECGSGCRCTERYRRGLIEFTPFPA